MFITSYHLFIISFSSVFHQYHQFTITLIFTIFFFQAEDGIRYKLVTGVQTCALPILVFQLGHCVEEAAFPLPRPDTGRMEAAWAVHQVETTVDFARDSRLITWFVGGLTFQIEHHLFPRICHLHYPALATLVEETSKEFGLRYQAHKTLRAALVSHF